MQEQTICLEHLIHLMDVTNVGDEYRKWKVDPHGDSYRVNQNMVTKAEFIEALENELKALQST